MYGTYAELKLAIGYQVTSMQGSTLEATFKTALETILTNVSNAIDAMIATRYDVSTLTTNAILKRIALSMAAYDTWRQYARNELPESVRDDYRDTMKLLEKIQRGDVGLMTGGTDDPEPIESEFESVTQVFSTNLL